MDLSFSDVFSVLRDAADLPAGTTTFDAAGSTFRVTRDPNPGITLRLQSTDPDQQAVLLDVSPSDTRAGAYPDHAPFVPSHPMRFADFGTKRVAVWWVPPDPKWAEDGEQVSLGHGVERDELAKRAVEFGKAYRDAATDRRAELKSEFKAFAVGLVKERAAAVRADPESRANLMERMDALKEAFGGSEAIEPIMEAVLEGSWSEAWETVEDKTDPTGSFRHVLLRHGEWAREVAMTGIGPAKTVMLTDTRTPSS